MTIRFGNQDRRAPLDSEFLPDAEHINALDRRTRLLDHLDKMTKRFNAHNDPVYCRCEFCRVYRETL